MRVTVRADVVKGFVLDSTGCNRAHESGCIFCLVGWFD